MSQGISQKHPEAAQASRRIPSSNSAAPRSIEVPVSNLARDSSTRSALDAAGQATWPSSSGPPISRTEEATLLQRRIFYGEDDINRSSDGTDLACELQGDHSKNAQHSANYALKPETTDSPTGISQPVSQIHSGGTVERVRQLSRLTARAEELRGQQEGHQQKAQELRGQIKAGELACGRMTQQMLEIQAAMTQMSQQVLEIQRAIGLRKRHVNEDEERLSQELLSRAQKTEEIMEIVSQTNAIAVAMSAEASFGNP